MASFEHYLYVLQCGDGSLYTGYTTDVPARVAKHQAGKGAKYTKAHAPVTLLAQARFYSKERALSAEALFKQLSRTQKEEVLAKAVDTPLEKVLTDVLPGFAHEPIGEFIARSLSEQIDEDYRAFNAKLIPNVDTKRIIGVRTPDLRKIAREASRRDDARAFLKALPHRLFEEDQMHAFIIGHERDYETALALYDAFLPYVNNWATCDQLPVKILETNPERTLEKVAEWLGSGQCYTIRFGMGVLMRLFLDERFDVRFLDQVTKTRMPESADGETASEQDVYYVDMMRAWFFAEALAKQEADALPYLERTGEEALLDEWTRRKAIQKAIESRRISDEMKEHLRTCRNESS